MKKLLRRFLYRIGYKNSIVQKLYVFFMSPINKAKKEKKAKKVSEIGNDLLELILSICKETNVLIWPEFGTLLGAYRDKSFISFDPDIDLGIISSDFSEELLQKFYNYGCVLKRQLHLVNKINGEEKLIELTLEFKGLCFDLFLSDPVNSNQRKVFVSYEKIDEIKNIYKCKYYTVKYTPSNLSEVSINNLKLSYPAEPDKYLALIYGESFMTPIKGWIPPTYNPIITYINPNDYFVQETKG